MTDDPRWLAWTAAAIEQTADRYRLVINPIIYAEVSIRYSQIEELEEALPKVMFDREALPMKRRLAGSLNRRRGGISMRPSCSKADG